jgi:hypothetical protein
MQGNLAKLKKFIGERRPTKIDFTSVHGSERAIKIDDETFDTANWGPILLAIESNRLNIV